MGTLLSILAGTPASTKTLPATSRRIAIARAQTRQTTQPVQNASKRLPRPAHARRRSRKRLSWVERLKRSVFVFFPIFASRGRFLRPGADFRVPGSIFASRGRFLASRGRFFASRDRFFASVFVFFGVPRAAPEPPRQPRNRARQDPEEAGAFWHPRNWPNDASRRFGPERSWVRVRLAPSKKLPCN